MCLFVVFWLAEKQNWKRCIKCGGVWKMEEFCDSTPPIGRLYSPVFSPLVLSPTFDIILIIGLSIKETRYSKMDRNTFRKRGKQR